MARENLKAARAKAGMTQEQVAQKVGTTLRHYQRIESAQTLGSIKLWDTLEDLFSVHQRVLRQCDREGNR